MIRVLVSIAILALAGCSTTAIKRGRSEKINHNFRALSNKDRKALIKNAQKALGMHQLKVGKTVFRADCSGTIRAIFAKSQIFLGGVLKTKDDNDVKAIYRHVRKYGRIIKSDPLPGDLVFFHNTYDRSRNGRMDNALTHIGLVETVRDGTITFIHHLDQTIIRSHMNLLRPDVALDKRTGQRINHVLRKAQGGYPPFTAAELFAGFGRL